MTKSEDATSGTTADHTKTSAESEKVQTQTSSGRGGRRDRGNTGNNTRDSAASTNKITGVKLRCFGAVLALKYEKVELKKSFDVFREKLMNYNI